MGDNSDLFGIICFLLIMSQPKTMGTVRQKLKWGLIKKQFGRIVGQKLGARVMTAFKSVAFDVNADLANEFHDECTTEMENNKLDSLRFFSLMLNLRTLCGTEEIKKTLKLYLNEGDLRSFFGPVLGTMIVSIAGFSDEHDPAQIDDAVQKWIAKNKCSMNFDVMGDNVWIVLEPAKSTKGSHFVRLA